ncbi:MAG: ABC transporter permease [Candidatus Lokiarchaeota archaeon]|nr:ABC transporter permease [Candidatus Lokiarchaeota archaeon]
MIGINLSMDAMGYDILSENFENQTVDVSIRSDRAFSGNFTYFTSLFNQTLTDLYPEIQNIFGAIKFESYFTVYKKSEPINWTFYEQLDYDWRWFNQTIFFGIDPYVVNQDRMQNVIQFVSPLGTFSPSQNEIYIDLQSAIRNNITLGDNITIGNYFHFYYPDEENHTYSIENITVGGFFNILDDFKFNYLFPQNYVYERENSVRILTSENYIYQILTNLWNNISNFQRYDPWQYNQFWHVGIVLDHTNFDYLNPRKIQVFYNKLTTDIVYSDISYNFEVNAYALNLIEEMEYQVLAFKTIASSISIPVLLLAWVLLSTNYHVVFNNRRREIGLLKTRFFTNAKLRRLYFSESTVFGILGGLAGIGFGLLSARYIYGIFSENTTFFSLISLRSFLSSALTGVILGTVLSLIASIKSTLTFSKLSTIESLQKYNVEIQTRPLQIRWWDWLLLIVTSLSIIFSILLDPDAVFSGPSLWQILLLILLPFFSVILPLSPFILSWVIAKFISTISLGFFTKLISKITRFFNRKTDFFVTRSITRNRWRSTRIVAIIAIALSFLFIADITAATETQHQQDTMFAYTGGHSAFDISATNLTRAELWGYSATLMEQENLTVQHSSILSITGYFDLEGSYMSGRIVYVDPTNYSSHVGDIDRFLGENSAQLLNALRDTPNGTLVPSNLIEFMGLSIGQSIFITYLNSTNLTRYITQELQIVGEYQLMPGLNPYAYNHLICKDFLSDLEVERHIWLINYENSENIHIKNEQVIQAMKELHTSSTIRSIYDSEEDELFSLLNFLEIEKYYFLILVAIGIAITMYNSIQEKSVDFGLLRARGVEKWTIVKTQLSEGLVFLTLGAIISLNGILSAWALNNAIGGILEPAVPRTLAIPIWRILVELGGSILLFGIIIIISSLFVLKQSNVKKISEIFRTA